ncbi:hypothetical protein EHI8A_059930 [Entamoeba histolytica HM-1:IMSS-B]|uniref:Cytidyltransferase-like domain-containing protein n=7 Tax=Entamoeba histolytica TaxID=5759 RepID=C4LTC1_ENTH1|nr:hypothetical protein, conserved [Entamoeba histolytica HM-1:IMSS]EMD48912.1 Hypothetical protein EHI5A_027020 [Entamoeba histolytica KU27]EMH74072.1 hypothetical protein EHI8A_059930 [Entamoeba histolytica HM-1:IMSS-B]EMS13637.1 Some similarities with, putative [Entamoeba histolytica HM-3:IMSS]ENY60803.1 Some similarities with, putative [Entamoeba histolytica HM-1:IMSS-A]BAN39039.1 hypothetical protein, conserved [Entamoeba histolytica]|eukprot:XP_657253.1 hypothetical protein, conserved [Entamoeba histolytica HM-1:IMSS]
MNYINASICVDCSINLLHVLSHIPSIIIPVKIENIQVKDVCLEASRGLVPLLSYPSNTTYIAVCISSNAIAIRDPIRLLYAEGSTVLNQLDILLTTFQKLPETPTGNIALASLQIHYINYVDSFFKNNNGVFCIELNGSITHSIPQCPIVYCGTFNPFHKAHKKIIEYMSMRFNHRPIILDISQRSEDKSVTSLTNVFIRASQVAGKYKVNISNTSLYIDKCKTYPGGTFVVGLDTAVRILNKRYYQNSEINLKKAMQVIASMGCNFIVVGRKDDITNRFLEFDSVKSTLPAKEYHYLFISLNEKEFRYDLSSTYLRANGIIINKNILPKL